MAAAVASRFSSRASLRIISFTFMGSGSLVGTFYLKQSQLAREFLYSTTN